MEVQRRETYTQKRNRLQFPKVFKQKCRVCGDYNMLLNGENSKECRNCGTIIVRGELQCGTIGTDGSFIGKMVEVFDENTNKWYLGRISSFNDSVEGINAKSYNIELSGNGNLVIKGITLPDENVRFA
jgi:hypothetical protein